jgi:hypothetical protein
MADCWTCMVSLGHSLSTEGWQAWACQLLGEVPALLQACRRGLKRPPMTSTFNVEELKTKLLHAVITADELLSVLGEAMG